MRAALLGCLLLACGGRAAEHDVPVPQAAAGEVGSGGGDQSGASGGSAPRGGSTASGGAPTAPDPIQQAGQPDSRGGAGLGEGGAVDAPPLIAPGTRVCQDYRDCLGLDCIGKVGKEPSMCSVACSDSAPCADNERCVSGNGLMPACVVRCDVGTECSYPFDCYDPYGDGAWVCVPAPWTDKW